MKAKYSKWERTLLDMIQKELAAVSRDGHERTDSMLFANGQLQREGYVNRPGRVEVCAREIMGLIRFAHTAGVINRDEARRFDYDAQGAISWEQGELFKLTHQGANK